MEKSRDRGGDLLSSKSYRDSNDHHGRLDSSRDRDRNNSRLNEDRFKERGGGGGGGSISDNKRNNDLTSGIGDRGSINRGSLRNDSGRIGGGGGGGDQQHLLDDGKFRRNDRSAPAPDIGGGGGGPNRGGNNRQHTNESVFDRIRNRYHDRRNAAENQQRFNRLLPDRDRKDRSYEREPLKRRSLDSCSPPDRGGGGGGGIGGGIRERKLILPVAPRPRSPYRARKDPIPLPLPPLPPIRNAMTDSRRTPITTTVAGAVVNTFERKFSSPAPRKGKPDWRERRVRTRARVWR